MHKKCSRQHLRQIGQPWAPRKSHKKVTYVQKKTAGSEKKIFPKFVMGTACPPTHHTSPLCYRNLLRDRLHFRNYLLMSLALWNGSRSMPLRLLSLEDIRQANIQTAPGEGSAISPSYRVVDVSRHKTARAWGNCLFEHDSYPL